MKTFLSKRKINRQINKLCKKLNKDYTDKNTVFVCVLKGAFPFFAEVFSKFKHPAEFDFVKISSYKKNMESGELSYDLDLSLDIENKDVIIIEDILDTGKTLNYFIKHLKTKNPNSIKICALLNKPSRRVNDIKPDYHCFDIEDYFVVGFGLDYAEKHRELDYVAILEEGIDY